MTKYTKRNPPPTGFCQLKLHILTARKSEIEIDMVADDQCRGEIMDAIARMWIRTADTYQAETANGHCTEGDRCVCGGDLPRVRQGCANWVTPNATAKGPA